MAAPLAPAHHILLCRGTPIGNHWFSEIEVEKNHSAQFTNEYLWNIFNSLKQNEYP